MNTQPGQTDARFSHGKPWSKGKRPAPLESGLPLMIWKLERSISRLTIALFAVHTVIILTMAALLFALAFPRQTASAAEPSRAVAGMDDMMEPGK